MRLRSLLFVPGDRPDRMASATASGADALILDLEDAVAPSAKETARTAVRTFLARRRRLPLFVRVNAVGSPLIADDLAAIREAEPDGIVLPKAEGAASIRALDALLGGGDLPPILPIATETATAIFALGSYAATRERLCGLTWGAEDLPAAIGAATSREEDGVYTAPFQMVRSLALFGAHAAGVAAIETVYPAFRDLEGLAAYARRGARDGFTGMMAIHPTQIAIINAAFTPDPAAIVQAQRIVALFEANPGAGALAMDGRMVDAPHLAQARRLLAAHGSTAHDGGG